MMPSLPARGWLAGKVTSDRCRGRISHGTTRSVTAGPQDHTLRLLARRWLMMLRTPYPGAAHARNLLRLRHQPRYAGTHRPRRAARLPARLVLRLARALPGRVGDARAGGAAHQPHRAGAGR